MFFIPEFSLARTFKNRDLLWQTGSQFTNSPTLPSRAAAQTSLHKMYTFVYRTFIKFILFLPGTGTGCLGTGWFELLLYLAQMKDSDWEVSMPSWT